MKITRHEVRTVEVDVPDGHEVCSGCGGKGMLSDYDRGLRTLAHSPRAAAKEECIHCRGRGFVERLESD